MFNNDEKKAQNTDRVAAMAPKNVDQSGEPIPGTEADIRAKVNALPSKCWWHPEGYIVYNNANGDDLVLRKDVLAALTSVGTEAEAGIRSAALEEAACIAETCYMKDAFRFELGTEAATQIRALKNISVPAKVQGAAPTENSAWQLMDAAPQDGTEILLRYPLQGNVKELASFNTIHKFWSNKGRAVFPVEQRCEWTHLPSDCKPRGESSERATAEPTRYCLSCEANVTKSCGSMGCEVSDVNLTKTAEGSIGAEGTFLFLLANYGKAIESRDVSKGQDAMDALVAYIASRNTAKHGEKA